MKSKAKIKEMIEQAEQHQTRFETQETIDMLKKVYRDLEVLEILKRHIKQGKTFALYDVETNNVKTLDVLSMEVKENDNGYDILKEWLDGKDSYQGSEKE